MPTVTVGRNPTLGEVIGYYTRDDFSRYLLDTLPVRPVVLVLPAKLHWEPNWPRDEIQAENAEELRAFVQAQIAEHLPGVALDERPPFYPSFHQAVWTRSLDGDTSEPDCFFEADLPTWRDAFGDVRPLLELMEDHGVYYQHKFSGHRSLHVAIPSGALPRGYRGKNLVKLIRRLFTWSRSQAHRLPRITRMPYSLNEDTGLVCLPIERGDLGAFRPWQANLHLVEVRDIWQDDVYPEADIDGLVSALDAGDPSTLTAATFLARQGEDWGREILVEALADSVRREAAVEFLRELRDERCVPYLVEQLRASTDWHGSFLGHELGHIGGDRAVAALIEASSREQVLIRRGAIRGLGETRDPAAIEPLIERIAQDTDSKVRKYAAEALLSIGPAAVGPMRRALVENRFLGRHRQSLIAETLSKLGAEP
jgi:hypothetical protein